MFWKREVREKVHGTAGNVIVTYGISVTQKKILFQFNNTMKIQSWDYDPVTGLTYGVGY